MSDPTVAFVDTETTGLDADRHEIWEVGAIIDDVEHRCLLPVDLSRADPIALGIGGFHERHPQGNRYEGRAVGDDIIFDPEHPATFASDFARITHGRHLVGAVISFDEERLRKLLLRLGVSPSWHYHLVDVEALAVGYLHGKRGKRKAAERLTPPWSSEEISLALGVDPARFDRHTAIGDAQWAKAIYEAVTG